MNATQRPILGAGLLIALTLAVLPPWQSTIFTQDKKTRAQLIVGPTPEQHLTAWLVRPPPTGYDVDRDKLETWTVYSVDWSRLAAQLLADGLACAVLIVLMGHPRGPGSPGKEASQVDGLGVGSPSAEGPAVRSGGFRVFPGRG